MQAWREEFSVGHPELDEQHRTLLKLSQQAERVFEDESEEGTQRIHDILDQLVTYAETHFREEEKLLRTLQFPQLSEHRIKHLDYQLRLAEFLMDAEDGSIDRQALFNYLSEWWSNHILEEDMEYKSLMRSQE